MGVDNQFAPIRERLYKFSYDLFGKIASSYGYPEENTGMPILPELSKKLYLQTEFYNRLPTHKGAWPPSQQPVTWFEMIFGTLPKIEPIVKTVYETPEEGFYNFYIQNYKNLFFLPDPISEFIQIRLHMCLDISALEITRELIFIGLILYYQMVVLRITLVWFIYINPYTIPWCYIVAAVDWTEDVLQGLIPTVFGVNITGTLFLKLIGKVADSINHLAFTMPFLPSEGIPVKLMIKDKPTEVLIFHYLPTLWYKHPIPNDLREFWYYKRPDIFEYMINYYQHLEINFFPDEIIKELSKPNQLSLEGFNQITNFLHSFLL